MLPDETRVGDMDYFGDGLLALSAVKQEPDLPRQSHDTFTNSNNTDMSHGYMPAALQSPTPSRQPLQSVNRQLSVPSMESHDETWPIKYEEP